MTPATVSAVRENTEWECGQPAQTTVNRNVEISMEKENSFQSGEEIFANCQHRIYLIHWWTLCDVSACVQSGPRREVIIYLPQEPAEPQPHAIRNFDLVRKWFTDSKLY